MKIVTLYLSCLVLIMLSSIERVRGQITTTHYPIFETTALQSMWGNDPSFSMNDTINLFERVGDDFTFDTRPGSIASFAGIKLGLGLYGGFKYGIGPLRFRISGFETGSIGVKYPIKVDIEMPADSSFNAGELVTINTTYEVEPGYELNTFYPAAGEIALELPIQFDLRVNVEFCLFSCFDLAIIPPYPLVIADPMIDVVYPIFKINETEVTYPCTSTIICTQSLSIPALEAGPVSGSFKIPYVTTTVALSGNDLVASGSDPYMVFVFDIIQFLGMLPTPAKPVFNAINGGISLPPGGIPDFSGDMKSIDITWSLFSMTIEVPISQSQEFIFSPTVVMEMSFPEAIEYEVKNPATGDQYSGKNDKIVLDVGNDITIRFPCDYSHMDMTAKYSIEDEDNISNRTFDHVDVEFVVSALTFAVDFPEFTIIPRFCIPLGFSDLCFELVIPGYSFGFGPLIGPYTVPIVGFDFPPYFNDSWSLGGLNVVDIPTPFRLTPRKFKLQLASTPTLCFGDKTGTATLGVLGATAPYRYEWSNGSSMQNLSNAKAGKHYINVTDVNGCKAYNYVVIDEPLPILNSVTGNSILCAGAATGDATVVAEGGTLPYAYTWTPSGAGSPTASLLNAGLHKVQVVDGNGCAKVDSIVLTEPKAIRTAISNVREPSCNGFSDGSITMEVSGGIEPYAYAWSNTMTSKDLLNIPAGNYTLVITDKNNCTVSDAAALNEPAVLTTTLSVSNQVSCKGNGDGELIATTNGGTTPYTYKWLNNTVTLSGLTDKLNNLKASTYSVEVTDKKKCSVTDNIVVTEPSDVLKVVLSSTNVICYGNSDGSVSALVTGGTSPYSLLWSNGLTSTINPTVSAGKHSVAAVDARGCKASGQVLVTQPAKMVLYTKGIEVSCADQQDGVAKVESVAGGKAPYTYTWSTGEQTSEISNLADGSYTIEVIDQDGCSANAEVIVIKKKGSCLFIPSAFSPNGDGVNDTWVIRNIQLYPNSSLLILNKWGETIFEESPYSTPWDGKRKGVIMPLATYYYILDLGNGEPKYTGPLTIIK